MEGIGECRRRWNVENVVGSLVEAWQEVPRDLIIASFQRTSFRTDDCFLEIRCNAWENLKTGVSFRKFVTFDDYLPINVSYKQCKFTGRNHSYNLRTREAVRFDYLLNSAINSKERDLIVDHAQVNRNFKKIHTEQDVDWKRKKLKRSHDKAQLGEDLYEEAKSSDESTSRENKDIIISTSARPPKVINIQTIESTARSSISGDVHSTQESVKESRTEYDCKLDKTANSEEKCKNSRVLNNERSIESSEVDNANGSGIASQQVLDDTSAVDSGTKKPNARVVSCATPKDEIESADLDENIECSPQKSLKRRSVDAEESQNNSNDGESERKRSRSDSDWMKQYETTFVFGPPDLARTVTTVSADILSDNGVPQLRPRRSGETERSIFTISPKRIRDLNSSFQ